MEGASPNPRVSSSEVVARVRGEPITRAELEAPLRLRLYDLERAAWKLRRQRLLRLIAERLDASESALADVEAALESGEAEILLEPPARPRLSIGTDGALARGRPDAPVELVVFCDFQSVHCARWQAVLESVLEAFPERVRLVVRDAPLPFHRDAEAAAVAARCADEQGAYWRYSDALYALGGRIDGSTFTRFARALELDLERFEACMAEPEPLQAVRSDAGIAARLGIGTVPVSFVNGLYVKGPVSEAELRAIIQDELVRLGFDAAPAPDTVQGQERAVRSELPLELVGTLVTTPSSQSLAWIRHEQETDPRPYRPGDEIVKEVLLEAVEPERAWLRHAGRLEILPLSQGADGPAIPRRERVLEAVPAPSGVVTLSREAVDRALENRRELARDLRPGQLELEGRRLLKLGAVAEGSLYDRMGLAPGDVLMQVNGRFVHDAENPLWEALRTESRIVLTVMRTGFPRTFAYEIE